MKPTSFVYYRAHTIAEAISLISEHGDDVKVLAGGQSLVPAMNFRLAQPAVLVDINRVAELDFVIESSHALRIGSLVRHATFERRVSDDPLNRLLNQAVRHVGHHPIRVRGTFGGSLAHADPAAEWCVIAALLDAEMVARNAEGTRTIRAGDFFQTSFTTDLRPDELLIEARLPSLPHTTKVGFSEFSRRAGDFALTLAAVAVDLNGDVVKSARIAFGGVSDRPVRSLEAEQALVGERLSEETFDMVGNVAFGEVEPLGDIHGSAEYRRDLVRAMTKRALRLASSE